NMNLAEGGEGLTFKFNIDTLELVVVGEGDEPNPPTPPTPGTVELYLRGDMNGWGILPEYKFSTTDNVVYTLEVESVEAGISFKIADESWDVNYGGVDIIALDTPVELSFGGGNMALSQSAKDVKFTFNAETLELTVTGDVNVGPVDYTLWKVAIVGDFNDWNNEANATSADPEGNVTITQVQLGVGEFKIKAITPGGEIWHSNGDIIPLNTAVAIPGNESANMTVYPGVASDVEDNCVYTFKFSCATNEVYVTLDYITGVEGVEAADANAVYYNMQGVQVKNPTKGIYVKVIDGKASKVNLK
ncbi:MAG: hypothetical protein K2F87_05555, partial [Muribaculaceae bacterium]|nr:hypothetical protein [Muribaculaceae bacterium]